MENLKHKGRKPLALSTIFLRYFMLLCGGMLLWLGLLLGTYFIATAIGEILPANEVEKQIAAAKDVLVSSPEIRPNQIPSLSEYALYTQEGQYVSGSLNKEQAQEAWKAVVSGSKGGSYGYYTVIQREQQREVLLLSYSIVMNFRSEWLRTHLPNPELMGIILIVVGFLLQIVLWSYLFGKKLAKKMKGLQSVIGKIRNQDLEFTVQSSGVHEIDSVLDSLDTMKNELKASLRQQWEEQQARREQISALAHDIKTPLTIIRGNAELLSETAQDEIQREYNRYILTSSAQIERYARELIEISRTQEGLKLERVRIDTVSLFEDVEELLRAGAIEKEIRVQINAHNMPDFIAIDKSLFQRAMLNVVMNAVEHTPVQGTITLTAEGRPDSVCFIVDDSGGGFTSADLREATKQFYMGDRSRSSGHHHGMGLYIAQSIMLLHGGQLVLGNDGVLGGAKVTLEFPLS
ncbi:hypothetical protein A8L34_02215 [Bacillus sp. FJAT-27264]|uniref:sensor histidine kinase n=1 Tax=Paenibacillus sp. (strain DSM 101736 / FJAT-27264) TaxID=1850362 RepID=UPI000807D36C|nr:HAMP domain-containing sensor histidine kinase [Bacillus sp. FJAT-27264]OBZ18420.1 hypothetical protein A8L34_02215 [Bacillus sp. FJAT-27264]